MGHSAQNIPSLPTEQDQELARESGRKIAAIIGRGDQARLCVHDGDDQIVIPMAAMRMLSDILNEMAQGNAFSMVPIGYTLTTQQAADLMNVSRPYFVKLLEQGDIEFTRVGRHRRVKFEDVAAYMEQQDQRSREHLSELTKQAQGLGMGY